LKVLTQHPVISNISCLIRVTYHHTVSREQCYFGLCILFKSAPKILNFFHPITKAVNKHHIKQTQDSWKVLLKAWGSESEILLSCVDPSLNLLNGVQKLKVSLTGQWWI